MSNNNTHHRGQTGPRTPEGKQRSSRNAVKHGLTAEHLVISDDERDEFEEFRAALWEEISPSGPLQVNAFNHLLHAGWQIQRIQRIEGSLFAVHANPFADEAAARQLDRMARYLAMHQRNYNQALRKLERLQTNAFAGRALPDIVAQNIRPLISVKEVMNAKRNKDKYWPGTDDAGSDAFTAAIEADHKRATAELAAMEAANG